MTDKNLVVIHALASMNTNPPVIFLVSNQFNQSNWNFGANVALPGDHHRRPLREVYASARRVLLVYREIVREEVYPA